MNHQALGDVKVLEFADFVSGPYCGKLLSNQGAQVIKIEKPGLGDKARNYGPFPDNLPHPEKKRPFPLPQHQQKRHHSGRGDRRRPENL